MILYSQKTLDQRRFNAPKIIENENMTEMCSVKEHHAEVLVGSKTHENIIWKIVNKIVTFPSELTKNLTKFYGISLHIVNPGQTT